MYDAVIGMIVCAPCWPTAGQQIHDQRFVQLVSRHLVLCTIVRVSNEHTCLMLTACQCAAAALDAILKPEATRQRHSM